MPVAGARSAPVFREAMVRGRRWDDIQTIVSRICGICSISHSFSAIKAVENALGLEITEQADKIRLLLHFSEQLQSHVLHVGYLVAPICLAKNPSCRCTQGPRCGQNHYQGPPRRQPVSELIAGRITHPITIIPGGLSRIPTEQQFRDLQNQLKAIVPDLVTICQVVLSVADKLPNFIRETEYVSLAKKGTYAFYHGDITSSDGHTKPFVNGVGRQRIRPSAIDRQVVQMAS